MKTKHKYIKRIRQNINNQQKNQCCTKKPLILKTNGRRIKEWFKENTKNLRGKV